MSLIYMYHLVRNRISSIYSVFRNRNNISTGRKDFSLGDILTTEKNEVSAIYEERIATSNKSMYLTRDY